MAEYTIVNVEERDEWQSQYGTMKDYALQLQEAGQASPEQGWVKLSQKLDTQPPRIGSTLAGIIETKTNSNGKSYKKFKKVNPNFQANRSAGGGSGGSYAPSDNSELTRKLDYVVQMLEELTGRRDVVDGSTDVASPSDEQLEDPFAGLL